jgi:hypothetical protein
VGVLGNGVAIWVWMGERRKSTTTLLFIYLAVSDTMVLICSPLLALPAYYSHIFVFFILWSLAMLALALSVHTTAIITFNRWLAVWKPLHVSTIMSKRRVVTVTAVTFFWCVLLVSADATLST